MDSDKVGQAMVYISVFLIISSLITLFVVQHNKSIAAQLPARYMMDDYGNIYSMQPCKDCKNCIQLQQIDTAEIKVKAFDFVPR